MSELRLSPEAEAELDDEVREFYRTMVDREISRGVPEREARRLARLSVLHFN